MSNPQQKRILIIDDDAMNREVMEAFLSLENYIVELAFDGQQGIDAATNLVPDLVILDVRMPDMSGYEVCKLLKNQTITQHIPIMFVSGFDAPEDRERGEEVGADDFLTRPFDADDFLERVSRLISN